LTEQGRKLNQHTRDSVQFQRSLFQKQSWLRIGTNREFAARVIGKHFDEIQSVFSDSHIRIMAFENGTENALLEGSIDLGIDCERPFSPEIAYKTSMKEAIVAVASPKFKKEHQKEIRNGRFFGLPHLLCDRLAPDRILVKSDNSLNTVASFNDIATTRSACQLGIGWALLPKYAVLEEMANGSLVEIESMGGGESTYGIWRLRGRKYLEPSVAKLHDWLKKVELS
jgi:DNA-binding transcriptional LysR family regulator